MILPFMLRWRLMLLWCCLMLLGWRWRLPLRGSWLALLLLWSLPLRRSLPLHLLWRRSLSLWWRLSRLCLGLAWLLRRIPLR
jgi:hypothetical protein